MANNSKEKVFRTAKQCRQHWNCYLNPAIKKGPWSVKEDIRLLENVLELNCMKKWSQVAKSLKGRTQNAVKNRFSLLLEKERKKKGDQNQKTLINKVLMKLMQAEDDYRGEVRSQDMRELEAPNRIFQESQDIADAQNDNQKRVYVEQKKTATVLENQKGEEKIPTKVIIPTVVPNQVLYVQPQFYQITPEFTPYFVGLMYGGHYRIN